jgi:hemerythrin-like domain-containing protein
VAARQAVRPLAHAVDGHARRDHRGVGVRRSPELVPLSRDHHVALAHALGLRRATSANVAEVVSRFLAFFIDHGRAHFAAEEEVLLPHVQRLREDLATRLVEEHVEIRTGARALGGDPTVSEAHRIGELLSAHVRFEERALFPLLESSLSAVQLDEIGRRLARAERTVNRG